MLFESTSPGGCLPNEKVDERDELTFGESCCSGLENGLEKGAMLV